MPSQGHVPPWQGRKQLLYAQAGGVGIRRGEHPWHSPTAAHPKPCRQVQLRRQSPVCSGATRTPGPSSRPRCPSPCPDGHHSSCLSGPHQGDLLVPAWAASTRCHPIPSSSAPDPRITALTWALLPVPARPPPLTLSQNTPLHSLHNHPEAGTAQNKPTRGHPSNRGVTCWSYWDRSYKQFVPSRALPHPSAQHREPGGSEAFLPLLGAPLSPVPRTAMPQAGGHRGPPRPLYLGPGAGGGQEGSIHTVAAPGGSSLFYLGCNGAGLVQAEEDPLQQREPSRFAFPSTCHCWSPFKGHATLPCAPRAGDAQTQRRGRRHREGWRRAPQHPRNIPGGWPG